AVNSAKTQHALERLTRREVNVFDGGKVDEMDFFLMHYIRISINSMPNKND
ncbi:unnamed protein product, partial [Ceratitis capitata]